MSHQEEVPAPAAHQPISKTLEQFFNQFDTPDVCQNLLFISGEFAENPPEGISPSVAFQWLYEMHSLSVLLQRLHLDHIQSSRKNY